jgi:hypothetical protein
VKPLELDPEEFLDLVFYFRIRNAEEDEYRRMVDEMADVQVLTESEQKTHSPAARKIPVPSWWQSGGTTVSEATMIADKMKRS